MPASGGRRQPLVVGLAYQAVVVVVVGAAALGLGSCQGHDDEPDVAAAVSEFQAAFERHDWQGMCARLTRAGRSQASALAHGRPDTCAQDVREALAVVEAGRGIERREAVRVVDVDVEGDRAEAIVAVDDRQAAVPLARESGTWRIDSFFGTAPETVEQVIAHSRAAPFPDVSGTPAQGLRPGPGNLRCLGFVTLEYPSITGDCELSASALRVELSVMTPMGHFYFNDCEVGYHAWVDGSGRTWTDSFQINYPLNNGCPDFRECVDEEGVMPPWKGRISTTADGGFVHVMRACLRTCIGYYAGDLSFRLTPAATGWRAEAAASDVGLSGLRFDGVLRVAPGFDLGRAESG